MARSCCWVRALWPHSRFPSRSATADQTQARPLASYCFRDALPAPLRPGSGAGAATLRRRDPEHQLPPALRAPVRRLRHHRLQIVDVLRARPGVHRHLHLVVPPRQPAGAARRAAGASLDPVQTPRETPPHATPPGDLLCSQLPVTQHRRQAADVLHAILEHEHATTGAHPKFIPRPPHAGSKDCKRCAGKTPPPARNAVRSSLPNGTPVVGRVALQRCPDWEALMPQARERGPFGGVAPDGPTLRAVCAGVIAASLDHRVFA